MVETLWKILRRFQFGDDQAPEEETIQNIENGIVFQGAKLWVLILAIFVASLGLNTNSTAVIIGAMLISPLMGPILGMGLGIGVHDTALLKKAFKNYFVATLFSVATACIYFLLTPFDEVQSELLARTSPTIYDVLIALCGGLAGIIGLSSKSQRAGNVIPGVAIATALMPPLCTVGFGLATANWMFAAGAFYLYLINTVFISLATYIGVKFIFKFNKRANTNKNHDIKFSFLLTTVGVFVILPSLYMTMDMVRESIFKDNAHRFCKDIIKFNKTHLIGSEVNYQNNSIRLVLMGEEVDSATIQDIRSRLPEYNLNNTQLSFIQGAKSMTEETVKNIVSSSEDRILASTQLIAQDEAKIDTLKNELNRYRQRDTLAVSLFDEVKIHYPQIRSFALSYGTQVFAASDSLTTTTYIAVYETSAKLSLIDQTKLKEWLRYKLQSDHLILVQQIK